MNQQGNCCDSDAASAQVAPLFHTWINPINDSLSTWIRALISFEWAVDSFDWHVSRRLATDSIEIPYRTDWNPPLVSGLESMTGRFNPPIEISSTDDELLKFPLFKDESRLDLINSGDDWWNGSIPIDPIKADNWHFSFPSPLVIVAVVTVVAAVSVVAVAAVVGLAGECGGNVTTVDLLHPSFRMWLLLFHNRVIHLFSLSPPPILPPHCLPPPTTPSMRHQINPQWDPSIRKLISIHRFPGGEWWVAGRE